MIVYIANIRLPTEKAHGIQIMKTCEALARAGVEVELVVPTRVNLEIKEKDPFVYYQLNCNFRIRKLFIFDPIFLWKLPGGIYLKLETFFFLGSLFLYLLFQKDRQQRIFYTRDEYLLPLLQRFSGQVVWEAHTLPQNANFYLRYWQQCQRIIAISQGVAKGLGRMGIVGEKILVVPDGVDVEKFSTPLPPSPGVGREPKAGEVESTLGGHPSSAPPSADHLLPRGEKEKMKNLLQGGERVGVREELGLPQDKKIVMYTGHLYEWKGASTLLQTARNLKIQMPNIKFVFVGGANEDVKKFKQIAGDLDNVLILGHKPHAEIPKYLAAADVLVLPNTAKEEISRSHTSPLKLFEYLAARRPIVASDLPSIREILSEETAIFFIPDDAKSLKEAIRKALEDQELCTRISQNGWQLVQNFTWENRAKKILGSIS